MRCVVEGNYLDPNTQYNIMCGKWIDGWPFLRNILFSLFALSGITSYFTHALTFGTVEKENSVHRAALRSDMTTATGNAISRFVAHSIQWYEHIITLTHFPIVIHGLLPRPRYGVRRHLNVVINITLFQPILAGFNWTIRSREKNHFYSRMHSLSETQFVYGRGGEKKNTQCPSGQRSTMSSMPRIMNPCNEQWKLPADTMRPMCG